MTTTTSRLSGIRDGIGVKAPCKLATTANITLSGEQTIDSVSASDGDRVLVRSQTDTTENGIYVVSTGAWSRSKDFDSSKDIRQGTIIVVAQGTTYGDTFWKVSTANPIPGSALTFGEITDGAAAAATSAAAALVSEQNAATSETNAATSAAAALVSQQAVEASEIDAGSVSGNFGNKSSVAAAGLSATTVVWITEGGGGYWQLKSGDYSAEVTADTTYKGCYFADGTIASTTAAWVRIVDDNVLIEWFGPNADGSTDDSDVFQKACNVALLVGKPLFVRAGDYAIDVELSITLADYAHIIMDNNCIMRAIPNGGGYNTSHQTGIFEIQGSNVTIQGGQLIGDREDHDYAANGGGTHEFGHGIYIYAQTETISDILIDRVSIIDFPGDSIQLFGTNSGGSYYYPNRVTIQNCLLQDCRRNNISVSVGRNTKVINNRIYNAGITKYAVAGTSPKAGIDVEGGSCPLNTIVDGNSFEGNLGGSIIFYNGNGNIATNNFCDSSIYFQWSSNTLIANNRIRPPVGSDAGIEQTTGYITTQTSGYQLAIGSRFEIVSRTTLDFTTVGSADNTVGTQFVATAIGPLSTGDSVRRIVENIKIEGNTINGGTSAAISSSGMTRNLSITGNHIINNTGTAIFAGNQAGASGSVGGEYIHGNNIYKCALGIKSSGKNCTITANRIEECSGRSIYGLSTCDGGECSNNILINPADATNATINMTGGAWNIKGNEFYAHNASVTAAYGIFAQDTGCVISDNIFNGGTFGTAAIRTTYGAEIVGNKLYGVNAPKLIQCSAATGVDGNISFNYLRSVATGTQYAIHLYGGGDGWRVIGNHLYNDAATYTAAIDTSANTNSVVRLNLIGSGSNNTDATDTVSDNY